jgi:hypothetical protein
MREIGQKRGEGVPGGFEGAFDKGRHSTDESIKMGGKSPRTEDDRK